MDTNSLLIKAMTYAYPEELPVLVGVLPACFIKYGKKMKELIAEFPDLFGEWWQGYDPYKNMPGSYHAGTFTDDWGCVWVNEVDGMESIVTGHPIPNREDILTMKEPTVNIGFPHGFMYLRLLDLRGFEEAMIDFAEEPPELQILIDKVLNYNLKQLDIQLKGDNKILFFGDDLGMQKGLAIGAEKWRKYIKPCFKALFNKCKQAGKYVYMHTDGCIYEIMPDLKECGADMINPQFRANGLENLERVCKVEGRIPICLDLDRQLFPFATPYELKKHVEDCVKSLYLPEGGLALNLEIGPDNPLENIKALFEAVNEFKKYK